MRRETAAFEHFFFLQRAVKRNLKPIIIAVIIIRIFHKKKSTARGAAEACGGLCACKRLVQFARKMCGDVEDEAKRQHKKLLLVRADGRHASKITFYFYISTFYPRGRSSTHRQHTTATKKMFDSCFCSSAVAGSISLPVNFY